MNHRERVSSFLYCLYDLTILVEKLDLINDIGYVWFWDDVYILGSRGKVLELWSIIRQDRSKFGYYANHKLKLFDLKPTNETFGLSQNWTLSLMDLKSKDLRLATNLTLKIILNKNPLI